MKLARWVFLLAGLYGLAVIAPGYFLEQRYGADYPPPITHPEHYYGFLGVALAWQVLFLVLSTDPVRYRPLMLPAVLEKATFGAAVLALRARGPVPTATVGFAAVDLVLGALFLLAYVRTGGPTPGGSAPAQEGR